MSIVSELEKSSVSSTALQLLQQLMDPLAETGSQCASGMGAGRAIRAALEELHTAEKSVETTEQLMVSVWFIAATSEFCSGANSINKLSVLFYNCRVRM